MLVPDPGGLKPANGSVTLMDFTVDLPDMLSRDVGLRLCLAMVELIWMDVSSLCKQGDEVQHMIYMLSRDVGQST
jgi:hypothetical protein